MNNITQLQMLGKEIRKLSLILAHNSNSSHTGGALSMADILAVLYSGVLNISPRTSEDFDRDRLILSKGHCCASLYSVLALKGFIDKDALLTGYGQNGSIFFTHVSHKLNGIELSTGSLGHGLPVAAGIALGAKTSKRLFSTYCIVGDGELDEGSNWEAIMFAAHNKLDNLCLIIDKNGLQALGETSKVLDMNPLKVKLEAFNWNVVEIDGHDYEALIGAFDAFKQTSGHPTAIICNTIKGKGVSYMENNNKWHYSAPDRDLLNQALQELK